jgi:hypothetical protein
MTDQPENERRREKRLQLAEPIVARFGTSVVVVVDVSPLGARIEHYSRLERGTERSLRIDWGADQVGLKGKIVRSRVERFIPGDEGLTVYRSGVSFDAAQAEEVDQMRQIISNAVAATLVEQVANARGFWTDAKPEMPIFRSGILTTNDPHLEDKLRKYLPNSDVVKQRGFIRMTLKNGRWFRTWTLDPTQPEEGFTISAVEPPHEIKLLSEAYASSGAEGRELIRKLAMTSIEVQK